MKSNKTIAPKNLPSRSPIINTLVIILSLDYWNAPAWLWGVILTLWVFYIIAWVVSIYRSETVDIFSGGDDDAIKIPKSKSSFYHKMEEVLERNSNNHKNR